MEDEKEGAGKFFDDSSIEFQLQRWSSALFRPSKQRNIKLIKWQDRLQTPNKATDELILYFELQLEFSKIVFNQTL